MASLFSRFHPALESGNRAVTAPTVSRTRTWQRTVRRTLTAASALPMAALLLQPVPLLAADAAGTEPPAAQAAPQSGPITVIDVLGRQVTLKAPAKRVILTQARHMPVMALLTPDPVSLLAGWSDEFKTSFSREYQTSAALPGHCQGAPGGTAHRR